MGLSPILGRCKPLKSEVSFEGLSYSPQVTWLVVVSRAVILSIIHTSSSICRAVAGKRVPMACGTSCSPIMAVNFALTMRRGGWSWNRQQCPLHLPLGTGEDGAPNWRETLAPGWEPSLTEPWCRVETDRSKPIVLT